MFVNNIHEVVITDEDIQYTENVLLKSGQTFDEERVIFIKDLTTLDLQAVPGSGKTTALLAKLLIIERYLPFKDGSGVLVISHTNTAVNEIKEKIGIYCPKLFSYPNFIGTIQSFVNKFLAVPLYEQIFKKSIISIDSDLYNSYIEKYNLPYGANAWVNRRGNPLEFKQKVRFNNDFKLISNIDGTLESFPLKNPEANTYKALHSMKLSVLQKGILHYDDTYFLANANIDNNENIIGLLQKRFCSIFVDEMQDMGQHQYELMEKVFNPEGSLSTFQRIGDKNQAIYGGLVETDEIWADREHKLSINGTHRLSRPIAEVVKYFGIDYIEMNNTSSHAEDIKPHILIYNDRNIEEVIPSFSKIIKELIDNEKIPRELKNPFKAIAWRKEHDSHIALTSYFDFDVSQHIVKENYENLKSYLLFFENENKEFKYIRKSIIKALLRVLQLEDIKDDNDRFYTSSKLLRYLKEETENYDDFNLKLYTWCHGILIEHDVDSVYIDIKLYSGFLLGLFGKSVSHSESFLSSNATNAVIQATTINRNIYNEDGFDVEVSTVHRAKGETHTATLYLETFYHAGYESERLVEQFKSNTFTDARKYHIQSAKMAYVGFSRPTHLLCFAVHEDRVGDLTGLENWKKVHIDDN